MAGRSKREPRKSVVLGKRGLILCEGETEENYFRGLITQDKYRRQFSSISVEIFKPKDHSPVGLVNKAKELIKKAKRQDKNPYAFVWVVFDKDGHAGIAKAFEIARVAEINIAFTTPCFEYYVLLHFDRTMKPYTKCDDVISEIKKNHIPDYEKATNIFKILAPHKDTGLANSEWVCERCEDDIEIGTKIYNLSSYSNIHELVNYLYELITKKE
ncbi:RloB family protein [Flavobacterium mesophilum]|uniref:RloB family protein n=1 Tax=Flavobacterium mesophilum TaxID=3143495 RepID=UPI0031DE854F